MKSIVILLGGMFVGVVAWRVSGDISHDAIINMVAATPQYGVVFA